MLVVTVQVHGDLRARFPALAQHEAVALPPGASLTDLLNRLGHASEVWLACVNGAVAVAGRARPLADGDRIDLYPAIEGG